MSDAVGVVAALLVAGIGLVSGESALEMFITAISVAVAVVPEGLPAVVTSAARAHRGGE
jgi:Ca2+-transporting ATPase